MNLALKYNDLPRVEREVAKLYAVGFTKKEIAARRGKSIYTIDNQIRRLFEKAEVRKDTEFTCWYFYTQFNIQQIVISIFFLILVSLSIFCESNPMYRTMRMRSTRTEIRGRRNEEIEI